MSNDPTEFIPIPPPPPPAPPTPPAPPVPPISVPVPPVSVPPPPSPIPPAPVAAPYQSAYTPQPTAWAGQQPGQYQQAPAYAAPKQPSLLSDPRGVVAKLPLVAMVGLIGFSVFGLFMLIADIIMAAQGYSGGATPVFEGLAYLVLGVTLGIVWWAVLMTLKHLADAKGSGN